MLHLAIKIVPVIAILTALGAVQAAEVKSECSTQQLEVAQFTDLPR